MMRKIFDSLQRIHDDYRAHHQDMEQLVLSQEATNRNYEQLMDNALSAISTPPRTQTRTSRTRSRTMHAPKPAPTPSSSKSTPSSARPPDSRRRKPQ
jgi:hypothetical protein